MCGIQIDLFTICTPPPPPQKKNKLPCHTRNINTGVYNPQRLQKEYKGLVEEGQQPTLAFPGCSSWTDSRASRNTNWNTWHLRWRQVHASARSTRLLCWYSCSRQTQSHWQRHAFSFCPAAGTFLVTKTHSNEHPLHTHSNDYPPYTCSNEHPPHTHQWTSTRHSNVSIQTAKGIHHRHSNEHSSHYSNEHPSQATTGNVTLTCYFHIWQSNVKLKSQHITSPFDPDQTLSTLSLLTSCCFHSKLHAGVTLATVVSSWHDKLHHWNPQCWSAVAWVVANTALKVVYMTVYKGLVKRPAHVTLGGPKGFSQKMLSDFPNEMRTFCKSQLHTISRLFSLRESLRSHAAMKAAVHCCTHQYGEWSIFFITRIRSHTHHLCTADRSDVQITPPSRGFVAADTQALQPMTMS